MTYLLPCPALSLEMLECGLCLPWSHLHPDLRISNKRSTYLGQQVPDHCIWQVSLSSPGPACGIWQREDGPQVPPECFSLSLFLSLGLFPGSLQSVQELKLPMWAAWEGNTVATVRVMTGSLFCLWGDAPCRVRVRRLQVSALLFPHPFPRCPSLPVLVSWWLFDGPRKNTHTSCTFEGFLFALMLFCSGIFYSPHVMRIVGKCDFPRISRWISRGTGSCFWVYDSVSDTFWGLIN